VFSDAAPKLLAAGERQRRERSEVDLRRARQGVQELSRHLPRSRRSL